MLAILNLIFGSLALLSFALLIWQWLAARRFPLHERTSDRSFAPAVTVLKPLKGCDAATENCLRSWFVQEYAGPTQILFGVASAEDPAGEVVCKLLKEFPGRDAQLVVCGQSLGANGKISTLAQLEPLAKHDLVVVSDADVRVPPDFLANVVAPLHEPGVGLVNCFYRLANPTTLAMQWEAIAINADFWSQVLQSKSLKPLDFALGAVMITRRRQLEEIGGFKSLVNCLADDFQLGNRIARRGQRIVLSPVVVECWDPPMDWRAVWSHQLRWARTIRVSRPVSYFFSILSNVTLWALLWFAVAVPGMTTQTVASHDIGPIPHVTGETFVSANVTISMIHVPVGVIVAVLLGLARILAANGFQTRLTCSSAHTNYFWLVPIKDLLQASIWFCAFIGNRVEWRGQKFKLRRDGTLEPLDVAT
jgi:ceramide glucosyltransferase